MSNLPVPQSDELDTGLEDFVPSAAMPRVNIQHTEGTFKDNMTNEEFATLRLIALGMVRQRVMWHPDIPEAGDSRPQCKSPDAKTGYPNLVGPPEQQFPFEEGRINVNDLPKDEAGRLTLACEACPFAQWGPKNSNGKSKPPRCNERYTIPALYAVGDEATSFEEFQSAGIFSFKGSGITPWKTIMTPFSRNRVPLYSAILQITLERNKRGQVVYSVPKISKVGNVDEDLWPELSAQLREVRDYLHQPPAAGNASEKDGQTAGGNRTVQNVEESIGVTAPTEKPSDFVDSVAAPVSTASVLNDEDLPF